MSRAILATVFVVAVWLEPGRTAPAGNPVLVMLLLYLCWSGLLAAVAWRSWWWDFRLARLIHGIDLTVFITAVFLIESGNSHFSSPFVGFTAFLLISGMTRWGKRGVLLTGVALVLSYALAGALIDALGRPLDHYQFGRRLANMVALSVMMRWFGADVRVTQLAPMPEPGGTPGERRDQIVAGALAFLRSTFNARGAAIAVTRSEEPWVDLFRDCDGVFTHERLGPCALTEDFDPDADAALFDIARCRRIVAFSNHQLAPVSGPFGHALADACAISDGLLACMASATSHGQVLVWGMTDACIDDLPAIASLSREVGLALDREEMAMLAQSIAVSGVRNALARDLHDSVAQLLAGTLFRLEALRRSVREGRNPDGEIVAMRDALRSEQDHLRSMIDRLRRGIDGDRATDIVGELGALMVEMGQHWHIATTLNSTCQALPVSIGLAHELRQLVREAVANAVRHGQCSRVDLVLEHTTQGLLQISIDDNGKGFPATSHTLRPRSISERIDALGGQLRIASAGSGVRLDIELPLPIAA
jgi:signal transduction histidine kinase